MQELARLREWGAAQVWIALVVAMAAANAAVYWGVPGGLDAIFRFLDGPLYVYVAKTLYVPPPELNFLNYGLEPKYFAAYLPAYPLLIRLLSVLTAGDYAWAMLLATNLSSMLAVVLFYRVLRAYELVVSPLWTAILFCFFPARWFIYHAMGATEPLFLCFVFATFLADRARKPGLVTLFVLLASVTRIVGVLLIPVFAIVYLRRRDWRAMFLLPASGLGILATFIWYEHVFGDFFAYFTIQTRVLSPIPFLLFFQNAGFYKDITEYYYFTYVLYAAGTLLLWHRREFFVYCAVFYCFYTFFYANDLARMLTTIAPFALLVGYDAVLSRPAFRLLLPGIIVFDLVYAWGYIPTNQWAQAAYERLINYVVP